MDFIKHLFGKDDDSDNLFGEDPFSRDPFGGDNDGIDLDSAAQKGIAELFDDDNSDSDINDNHQPEPTPKPKSRPKINYLKKLKNMPGLDNLYSQVCQMVADAKYQRRMNKLGVKCPKPAFNLRFEGNPGTGKTMAARIIGKILYQEGFCSNEHFNEIDASNLLSDQVGQTGKNVRSYVRKSLGGVLFIDEAYELADKHTKYNGFDEVKASLNEVLLKQAEDYRGDLVIILAGYIKPMEDYINNSNQGLRSRFNTRIIFPDYSIKQLQEIFAYHANREYHLHYDSNTKKLIDKEISLLIPYTKRNGDDGNARTIRNVLELICSARNLRHLHDMDKLNLKQINTINASDVTTGFSEAKQQATNMYVDDKKDKKNSGFKISKFEKNKNIEKKL